MLMYRKCKVTIKHSEGLIVKEVKSKQLFALSEMKKWQEDAAIKSGLKDVSVIVNLIK